MSTYIDFIEAVSQNRALAHEFQQSLQRFTDRELSGWFHDKGFTVSSAECGAIMKNTKSSMFSNMLMAGY